MRKIMILLVGIMSIFILSAQDKLDLHSKHHIKTLATENVKTAEKYVSAVVKIENDDAIEALTDLGVKLINRRDELLLVFVPVSVIDDVLKIISISKVSIATSCFPMMDKARAMSNVDNVNNGIDLPQKYDGSGVVVGFSDIGFDPNHVNFKDEKGDSRVKRIVSYVDSSATIIDLETTKDIQNWETDHKDQCHATIVAGVLTGSYTENGYQGVAPGAEIVATTSDLYDGTILAGVENVVEYAKKEDKPVVVNISIGSYIGPHDGSSLFCQYLDRIGQEAIICMSAGNEGARPNVHRIDFLADGEEFKTFVFDTKRNIGVNFGGYADFWSADSREFKAAACIYDRIEKEIVYKSPYVGGVDNLQEWGMASDAYVTENEEQLDLFDGYVRIYSELNEENLRYNVMFSYAIQNTQKDGVYGRYQLGIILKGNTGVHVDGYSDGSNSYFASLGVDGFSDGQSDGSVSDLACGQNIIVVGSSNSKGNATSIAGVVKDYNLTEGDISYYSSYGRLIDGRCLPHICAPGAWVTSSISTPFVSQQSNDYKMSLTAKSTIDGIDYYWITECGTSISSPLAAGVFALWLQADPTLSVNDVKEIAMSTASKDVPNINNPQWGAGNLDAMSGLKEVLKRVGSIENIEIEKRIIFSMLSTQNVEVAVIGATKFDVAIFDVTGKLVGKHYFDSETGIIDLSLMETGIYLFEVKTDGYRQVERIIVR